MRDFILGMLLAPGLLLLILAVFFVHDQFSHAPFILRDCRVCRREERRNS